VKFTVPGTGVASVYYRSEQCKKLKYHSTNMTITVLTTKS